MADRLSPGVRLGSFEILAKLGAGGMGEVYKARDVRLDRTVAIKVLQPGVATDSDLRQRLEREARAIAALQHPHICTLHEFGHHDGTDYLVMEYLEGQTLAARLQAGPLPVDRTIQYALQIADALDRAHRSGIVHRDLKPGNIMLTSSGIKLLDFGLAKAAPHAIVAGFGDRETRTAVPLTGEGTILGTLPYMAPEQLEGQPADHRSDVWALGCIVYEMAAGTQAFAARTDAGLIAAILERSPEPLAVRQPLAPPALERILTRCLVKDPEERWQSARDIFLELRAIGDEVRATPRRQWTRWVAVSVLAAAALTVVAVLRPQPRDGARNPGPVLRLSIGPLAEAVSPRMPAIAPDGGHLAFVAASQDGSSRLWIWSMETARAHVLPGTEDASLPFWSPDSRSIAFFAGGKLKRASLTGGTPHVIADAPDGRGGAWNRQDVIVFAPSTAGGLHRVPAAGGISTALTYPAPARATPVSHMRPSFLPDGHHFLYLSQQAGQAASSVHVSSLDGSERATRIASVDSDVAFAGGFLMFARGALLMAQPFDEGRLELRGEARAVADTLPFMADRGTYSTFSVSAGGILCHLVGGGNRKQFEWLDHTGRVLRKVGPPGLYRDFDLTRDERRIAVGRFDPDRGLNQLWLLDVDRGTLSRFTAEETSHTDPVWSPDGGRLAFSKRAKGFFDLYQQALEANPRSRPLLESDQPKYAEDWSADGRFLLYGKGATARDLWVLPLAGPAAPRPLLESPFSKDEPQFSPDARWVAYASVETGRWEVYVTSFPDAQQKHQISTAGGVQPVWRGDGRELFYLALDGTVMSLDVDGRGPFHAGTPRARFATRLDPNPGSGQYAVSRDGRRFLILSDDEDGRTPPFRVVLNWPRLLQP